MKPEQPSVEQLNIGRQKALRNAEELVRDAEILFENQRWARSLFCAQIAVEELGKHMMLLSAAMNVIAEVIDWKVFWQRFRDHKTKLGNILLQEQFTDRIFEVPGARPWSEYLKVHDKHKKMNHNVKMWALYADFDGEEFICPSELIDEKIADVTLQLTKQRLESAQSYEHRILGDGTLLEELTKDEVREGLRRMGF